MTTTEQIEDLARLMEWEKCILRDSGISDGICWLRDKPLRVFRSGANLNGMTMHDGVCRTDCPDYFTDRTLVGELVDTIFSHPNALTQDIANLDFARRPHMGAEKLWMCSASKWRAEGATRQEALGHLLLAANEKGDG